jgi:hypothetical protein
VSADQDAGTTAAAVVPGARPRPWRILAGPGFRALWGAHLLTLFGEAFSFVAMPWLVLQLTGSGLALGTVLALEAVPRALLLLVGGALSDRFSPRLVMLGSAVVRAVLIGLLALLVLLGTVRLWEVYAVALLTGTVSAFFLPARFSILPRVAADHELEAGNALLNLNQQGSLFIAPALAGVLVAAAGPGTAFALDAGLFALATLLLAMLRVRPAAPAAPGTAEPAPAPDLLREIRDGLRYAWADVGIRTVMVLVAAIDFAFAAALQVVVGAGLRRVPARFGPLVIGAVAWCGVGLVLVGLSPNLVVAMAVTAAMGVATGVLNTYGMTWMQRRTDGAMQGRVMALLMLASMGLAPLSLVLAGLVAGQPAVLFGAAGAIVLVSAGGAALSRTVRSL